MSRGKAVSLPQNLFRRETITPVLLGFLALALGLHTIGAKSFWDDEGFSAMAIRLSPSKLLSLTIHHDQHTGLFHFLLKGWSVLGGNGESWLRGLSVLFGALAVPVFYFVAKRLFGFGIATVAAAALAVNGFFVAYTQEARPYMLTLFLVCASMWCFLRAVDVRDRAAWITWGIVGGMSVYAHPFAAVIFIAQLLSILALQERKSYVRNVVWASFTAFVIVGPLLYILLTNHLNHLGWVGSFKLQDLGTVLRNLSGRGNFAEAGIVIVLIAVFSYGTLKRLFRGERGEDVWRLTLIMLWALLLPIVGTLASLHSSVLVPRYFMPSLPGFVLATVYTVWTVRDRILQVVLATALVLSTIASVQTWYIHGYKDDWRSATAYVMSQAQPGDGIIFFKANRDPFEYYFLKNGGKAGDPPAVISPIRPWGAPMSNFDKVPDLSSAEAVVKTIEPYTRVWVASLDRHPVDANVSQGLQDIYGPPSGHVFNSVIVRLYTTAPAGGSNPLQQMMVAP